MLLKKIKIIVKYYENIKQNQSKYNASEGVIIY